MAAADEFPTLHKTMTARLTVLVAIHLILGCLPFFYSWVPPNVRYMPIIWLIGSVTVAQTMLLGFWMGMGTTPWRRRLLGTLLGCIYLGLPQMNGAALHSLVYGAIVFVLSGAFLVMRRWFVLQQVETNAIRTTSPSRLQFSIFHLLVLTALLAVMFGLVRSARLSSTTDSIWFNTVMYGLMFSTFIINAVCCTGATLAVQNYRAKLAATFLVSVLLGTAISLSTNRTATGSPPLPWWIWLGGIYITTCLTLFIVATLLVVRSCGYRLIPKPVTGDV